MPTQMNLPILVAEAVEAELARNPEKYRSITPGPKGDSLTLVSVVTEADFTLTMTFSDGTVYHSPPVRGVQGEEGVQGVRGPRGVGIHHTRWSASTNPEGHFGVAGHMDTYTLYGDEDESVVLGWFSVKNGADGKDPYDFAVEGGYEGTKDEFYDAIAENATNFQEVRDLIVQTEELFGQVENKGQEFVDEINQIIADFMALKGAPDGFAELDENGTVPVEQIPVEVFGLIRVNTHAELPQTGVPRQLYLVVQDETAEGASTLYHWSGFDYRPATNSTTILGLKELRELIEGLDEAKADRTELESAVEALEAVDEAHTEAIAELDTKKADRTELQEVSEELEALAGLVDEVNNFRELAFVAHRMHLPPVGEDETLYIVRHDETHDGDVTAYAWTIDGYLMLYDKSHDVINGRIDDLADVVEQNREGAQEELEDLHSELEDLAQDTRNELDELKETKVDKEDGKGLSDTNFTQEEKDKLAGLESSKYKGLYPNIQVLEYVVSNPEPGDYADIDSGIGGEVTRYFYDSTGEKWEAQIGVSTQLTGAQIKSMYEAQPDTNAFTDTFRDKLTNIEAGAKKVEAGTGILDTNNVFSTKYGFVADTALEGNTLVQTMGYGSDVIPSQEAIQKALDTKYELEEGKGLSSNDFTDAEKEKLAGLESSKYRGLYPSLEILKYIVNTPSAGDYADVDLGSGGGTVRYIYDAVQNTWIQQIGASTQLTGSQIKEMYEDQPDTNAFTDEDRNKLEAIEAEATKVTAGEGLVNNSGEFSVLFGTTEGTVLEGKRLVAEMGYSDALVPSQKAVQDALDALQLEGGGAGIPGKSAYQVAQENGFDGTVHEWLESLVGADGKSAFEIAVEEGFTGTEQDWLNTAVKGADGKSAYEIAQDGGFVGTEQEWLTSLKGEQGPAGKSAYESAIEGGFVGTESEWAAVVNGVDGKSAYELAQEAGFTGSLEDWLTAQKGEEGPQGPQGPAGKSAYEVAVEEGYTGTQEDWVATEAKGDKGDKGEDGKSAYEVAVDNGFAGTEQEWVTNQEKGQDAFDWGNHAEAGYVHQDQVLQSIGTSTEDVMSQAAVTEALGRVPSIVASAATSLSLEHRGKCLDTTANVTIPAGVFSVGDVVSIAVNKAEAITVSPAAGVTLRIAGTSDTGAFELEEWGMVTLRMTATNNWRVIGVGIA